MAFRFQRLELPGLVLVEPVRFEDRRGIFMETYKRSQFAAEGIPEFVQDNYSRSKKGVIRGLHFQWDPPMGKLMRVTYGTAFLVAVDIRKGSPTLGQWCGIEASAENKKQLWAPASFARGFCALSDFADVQYKCTGLYNSKTESGIRWDDPQIGIRWPVSNPLLSEKDRQAQTLADWLVSPNAEHFRY